MISTLCRLFVLLGFIGSTAAAQDLTLEKDCESGFRQIIEMAQQGSLGDDVTNANVSVDGKAVEIELVRANAPGRVLRLTAKQSPQRWSRYFDIVLASGATTSDAQRLGQALDAAFTTDPFKILGHEARRGDDPVPGVFAAWGYGGWHGVARALEMRMMVLASVRYTVAVIVLLGTGLLASLVLLWGSLAPDDHL